MIKIGLKGLVKFMTAKPAAQRKVLRDYKYPKPEGHAQALYYQDAVRAIGRYHRDGSQPLSWLEGEAQRFLSEAQAASGTRRTRLRHNARALNQYGEYFGTRNWIAAPLEKLPALVYGSVQVNVKADLRVLEGNKEWLIKFEFSEKESSVDAVKVMTQLLFESARQRWPGLPSSAVLYVDVAHGTAHKGARLGARVSKDIDAACKNIEAIWDSI
jgi:hypothetical protein